MASGDSYWVTLLYVVVSLVSVSLSVQRKICGPDSGDMSSVVKSLAERYIIIDLLFLRFDRRARACPCH